MDLSRRQLLAACGAGAAGLAGCSSLPGLGEDEDGPSFDYDALERTAADWPAPEPPAALPVEVTDADITVHRERAEALLAAVPESPSIPNGATAQQIADDRERAANRLDEPVTERGRDRLEEWRRRRSDAANVWGAYLAAVGEIDREAVEELRRDVRSSLADFEVDWDYRAADPVEAVAVHAVLEDLVETCRRALESGRAFPGRPQDAVFRVGDLVEGAETAAAAVADARRLRERYRDGLSEPTSHRAAVTSVAERLLYAVSETQERVSGYLDGDPSSLDRDVEGTPAADLYRTASWGASNRADTADNARQRHQYATSVLEAGRALAAVEALDDALTAIYDGEHDADPTVSSVGDARSAAMDDLRDAWDAEPQSLAVPLARPATYSVVGVTERLDRGYGNANTMAADFAYARYYAAAVSPATDYVAERLADAASEA